MSENLRKEIEKELNGLKINLEKFSTAVDIFDEAKVLADQASSQIEKSFTENKKILDKTGDQIQKLIEKQQNYSDQLKDTLAKLSELQSKISESDIPGELEKLEKQITDFKKEVSTDFESVDKVQSHLENKIQERSDGITKEIADFKKEVSSDFDSLDKDFDKIKSHLDNKIQERYDDVTKEITGLKNELKKALEESKEEMLLKIGGYHKSNQTEINEWFKNGNKDLKENFTSNISKVEKKLTDNKKTLLILLSVIIMLQIVLLVSLFL